VSFGDTPAEHLDDQGVGAELVKVFERQAKRTSQVFFEDGRQDLDVLTVAAGRAGEMRQRLEAGCLGLLVATAQGVCASTSNVGYGGTVRHGPKVGGRPDRPLTSD
jgi:hypothetical protein